MSQWTSSRSHEAARAQHFDQYSAQYPAHQHHPAQRREPRARVSEAARAYTFAHGGRQVRFGPVMFWIAVGTVVIMAGWSITAATYLAFRDDVLRTLIAHQADQQFAYEDRIAELRAQIDRTTSRQLLDQEQFEQKLDALMRRQAALEQRSNAMGNIGNGGDPATTGSIGSITVKPIIDSPATHGDRGRQSSIDSALNRLEASLDRVEARQSTQLGQMETRYEGKARRIRAVLADLGLKLNATPDATGGPFVPLHMPPANETFERSLVRVSLARSDAEELTDMLRNIPIRKPVMGEIDETSPFGVRMDPFVHEAAMHTGIDFRGDIGEPVHATAAGTVTLAGWEGGYGRMVEIDHGNGLATRYGHLSEIDVAVGDKIRIGQVVGLIGTTGRSTGPHLHYETRVNGEAVNPQKFLDAGDKLFGG